MKTEFSIADGISGDTAISFNPINNGLRVSITEEGGLSISECYLNGKPICSKAIAEGNFAYEQSGKQVNIDIPLSKENSGILNSKPEFSVRLNSGKTLVTKASFLSSTDMAYSGKDLVLNKYIDDIASSLKRYKELHPQVSDKALNQYAQKMIDDTKAKAVQAARAYTDMDGYLSGILNSREFAIYQNNKAKALICMANGKFALGYAQSNYIDSVLHNGNGDAFRHALWNYGMTLDVGSSFAKVWSDAHEYGSVNQPAIERSMDLYNNAIGIQLGRDNPGTILHSTFISKTKEKVRYGKLWVIGYGRLYWSNAYGER